MKFLFLLLMIAAIPAEARILRGDWESYGDLPVPYIPQYSFKYDCQAELTDAVERKGGFRLFAIAKFSLSNEKNVAEANDLNWQWLKLNHEGEEKITEKPANPFSVKKHSFALNFIRGESGKSDTVLLNIWLYLPIDPYLVPQLSSSAHTRSDSYLNGSAEVYAESMKGKAPPYLKAQVSCDKVK